MYLKEELERRGVPALLKFEDGREVTADNWEERRLELVDILSREEYGYMPYEKFKVSAAEAAKPTRDCAGKAITERLTLTVSGSKGDFSFPLLICTPAKKPGGKCPLVLLINFRPDFPDKYLPAEEIIDRGVSVAMIYYNDIALDKNEWESGIAGMYPRPEYSWSKITMWAWAASRCMDYFETRSDIDFERIGVAGHSRLGKTALWCGANDTRFKYVFANNSGCSGDAITRCKRGETVEIIYRSFPFWFVPKYNEYAGREQDMPFDQHFVIAASAPRVVVCGAAEEDIWADPESQYLSCCAASQAWELLGEKGLIGVDRYPEPGDIFTKGKLGFFMRPNAHYFSRYDWNRYLDRLLV